MMTHAVLTWIRKSMSCQSTNSILLWEKGTGTKITPVCKQAQAACVLAGHKEWKWNISSIKTVKLHMYQLTTNHIKGNKWTTKPMRKSCTKQPLKNQLLEVILHCTECYEILLMTVEPTWFLWLYLSLNQTHPRTRHWTKMNTEASNKK